MGRIVIAILFVFAVVAQSASSADKPDGIRAPTADALPARLSEYAGCDAIDYTVLFQIGTFFLATPAIKRLEKLAFLPSVEGNQNSNRDRIALYELHAVWRI
jgi:hypothetical protein